MTRLPLQPPEPRGLATALRLKLIARCGMVIWVLDLIAIVVSSTSVPDATHDHQWNCFGSARYMTGLEHTLFLWVWMICLCLMFVSARMERRAFLAALPQDNSPWERRW